MEIRALDRATPFATADGSTIRSLLDRTTAPVQQQSLAEATVAAGTATTRHFHRIAEEFYFLLEGSGEMEVDGDHDRGCACERSLGRILVGPYGPRRGHGDQDGARQLAADRDQDDGFGGDVDELRRKTCPRARTEGCSSTACGSAPRRRR